MNTENIKFIVLTSTYKRSALALRSIESVVKQTYTNWELFVANDSPDDTTYVSVVEYLKKLNSKQIHYSLNEKNLGKNESMNMLLNKFSQEKNKDVFMVLLDDDDWLNEKALERVKDEIIAYPNLFWYVSNRVIGKNKDVLTKIKIRKKHFSYMWDYLIGKNVTGDATHIIDIKVAQKAHFPHSVKNGEEWFYFSQLRPRSFHYYDFDSTLSDEYGVGGVTHMLKSANRLKNTWPLFYEALYTKKISPLLHISVLIYFLGRIGKTIIKTIKEILIKR